MKHPIRSLTMFGGLAVTAALSGCNADDSPSSQPAPVAVPPAKTNPSPAPSPAVKDMKPDDTKGPEAKPADTKPAEAKPADTKPTLEPPAGSKDSKEAATPKG